MNKHEKEIPTTPDENKEAAQSNILEDEMLADVSGGGTLPLVAPVTSLLK